MLKLLCKQCEDIDGSFEEIDEYCGNLTIYGTQPRYPFELDITEADMKEAINEADAVMDFVRRKISSKLPKDI